MNSDSIVVGFHGMTKVGSAPPNGDAMLVGTGADPTLFAVADGMGGAHGSAASSLAVAVLADLDPRGSLDGAFRWANREMFECRRARCAHDARAEAGATSLVACRFWEDGVAELVHVGDSRAYMLRGGILELLTEDHSLASVPERRCGATVARRRLRGDVVARALGRGAEVRVDRKLEDACPGDRFVLCSDGLSDFVHDGEISRVLNQTTGIPQSAAWRLAAAATRAGGDDDFTVIVVDVSAATADSAGTAGPVDLGVTRDR